MQFWSFWRGEILIFGENYLFRVLKIPKFSICNPQILREIKFVQF